MSYKLEEKIRITNEILKAIEELEKQDKEFEK